MRFRTSARSLVLAGVLTGLGLGGYTGYQRFTPAPVAAAVSTSEVQVGGATATVSATGNDAVAAPAGTVTNGVVTYTVRVALDPQEATAAGVRVGTTASASIVVESREGVVVAPSRAIRTQGGARVVQVLAADGETETRQVQTGLAGDQVTEIVGGLQPGERLIVSGATGTASATGTAAGAATTASTAADARAPGATGLGGAGLIAGTGAGTGARPPTFP